jgi:lycopene cyclase CruP
LPTGSSSDISNRYFLMSLTASILTAIPSHAPGNYWRGLQKADELWRAYRENTLPVANVIQAVSESLPDPELALQPGSDGSGLAYDVLICGGTLGILLGAALARQGWRVALLERGILKGREQEWNISRNELMTFVEMGLLSEEQLVGAIATQYNPARISFIPGQDLWVEDILNIGVDPVYLLEALKQVFLAAGGQLYEQTPFVSATVHANGVVVMAGERQFKARLLIDGMGHFSPIARQARQGQRPDAVCLVVGTCAQGYAQNESGDLIVSFTPAKHQCQYFWEAFPARDGRTTYLFTYVDAEPSRPSLERLFDDYFALLPDYQHTALDQLTFKRALFGFFPAYRQSPLRYPWDRTLAIGDSSGNQSPLSFGGFGAMVRHLSRLSQGIGAALSADQLSAADLGLLNPYQPNLSVTWLFQKAMSIGVNQTLDENHINQMLATLFADMAALGDDVLRPFLQDVVQFGPLARTLLRTSLYHPGLVAKILPQVGLGSIINWSGHYGTLASYSLLNALQERLFPGEKSSIPGSWLGAYRWQRWQDALRFGSGGDWG